MAEALTPRQTEVLVAVLSSNRKQAALELGISVHTVQGHMARIRDRLHVENAPQAAYVAARCGLVVPALDTDRLIIASVHSIIPADTWAMPNRRAQGRARRSSLVGGQP